MVRASVLHRLRLLAALSTKGVCLCDRRRCFAQPDCLLPLGTTPSNSLLRPFRLCCWTSSIAHGVLLCCCPCCLLLPGLGAVIWCTTRRGACEPRAPSSEGRSLFLPPCH